MFINRKRELDWLKRLAMALQGGRGINAAILGLRRIGKTELILEFRKQAKMKSLVTPYLNIQSSMASPKRFCLDFMNSLLEALCRFKEINVVVKQTIEEDLPVIAGRLGDPFYERVVQIIGILNKGENEEALRLMFRLPEFAAREFDVRILFFIDEFQEIDSLKHYKVAPFSLMRTVIEKQTSAKYVVTGSLISFMERIFQDPDAPFFNQFSMLSLHPFTREDAERLAVTILDYDFLQIKNDALSTLFTITGGHPFYIVSICERAFFEAKYNHSIVDAPLIEYAFVKETLSHEGKLNILFEYIFSYSLGNVERKGALKQPLLILADQEGLTLSEISGALNKPSGQVSNLMKSLLKTDLIIKKAKKYYFRDPVFRFWLAKTSLGKNYEIAFKKKATEHFIHELQERFLRKSSDYGRATEDKPSSRRSRRKTPKKI